MEFLLAVVESGGRARSGSQYLIGKVAERRDTAPVAFPEPAVWKTVPGFLAWLLVFLARP